MNGQSMSAIVRTGSSGWSFGFWNKSSLYTLRNGKKIGGTKQLDRYASILSCVELNASFYRTPAAKTVLGWKQRMSHLPEHFKFVIKMNQYATHKKLLRDPESWWPDFWERMSLLGERMGPILIQLPPRFGYTEANMEAIATLEHVLPDHPFVFEFRHASWKRSHLEDLFTRTGWTVAVTHVNNKPASWTRRKDPWTKLDDGWSDMGIHNRFTYIRLHGTRGQYTGSYEGTEDGLTLSRLVSEAIQRGRPVWILFNNTDSMERKGGIRVPSAIRDAILFWNHANKGIKNLWNTFRKVCSHECPSTKRERISHLYREYKSIFEKCLLASI